MPRSALLHALALTGLCLLPSALWATAPCDGNAVRVISPHGNGMSDLMAHVIFEELSRRTGQTFVVEPVVGAGGVLGVGEMAKAAPDGCTLAMIGISTMVITPLADPKVGYDPLTQITPIAMVGGSPAVLAAAPDKGLADFDALRAAIGPQGRSLTLSTPGLTTITTAIPVAMVAAMNGTPLTVVPYAQPAEAAADAASGQVDMVSLTYSTLKGQIDAGALVPLAVSAPERLPDLPQVPTLAELGFADLTTLIWFGIGGPAGLPRDMVDGLNAQIGDILADAAVAQPLAKAGIILTPMSADAFAAVIRDQAAVYGPTAATLAAK